MLYLAFYIIQVKQTYIQRYTSTCTTAGYSQHSLCKTNIYYTEGTGYISKSYFTSMPLWHALAFLVFVLSFFLCIVIVLAMIMIDAMCGCTMNADYLLNISEH
jgi:hypothetical protein